MFGGLMKQLVRVRNFSTEIQKGASKTSSAGLTSYKDGQLVNRTAITLKKQEDI